MEKTWLSYLLIIRVSFLLELVLPLFAWFSKYIPWNYFLKHKCIPRGKYFSTAKVTFKLLTSCPSKHFREGTCQKPMLIFIEKKRRNNIVLKNLWNKLSMKVRVCCWEEISKISGGQVTHWHLSCKLRQSRKSILWYICFWQKSHFLDSLELSFSISHKWKKYTGSVTSNWDGAKNEMKWAPIPPLEDEQKLRPEASKHQKVAPDLRIVTSTTSSTGVKILSLVKFHTRSDNRSNTIITLRKLNSFLNLKVKKRI